MMKNRNQSIELLRVLAMFLIVVGHYCYHGIKSNPIHSDFYIDNLYDFIEWGGQELLWIVASISVDCYVLITGYFLADRITFRWKGTLNVWLQTVFYTVVFTVVFAFQNNSISIGDIVKAISPIYSKTYWFVTQYVGMMLVAPFLSLLLKTLSKRQYLILLTVGVLMCLQFLYGPIFAGTMSLPWFIYLYITAGYIKMYGVPAFIDKHAGKIFWTLVFLFFFAVTCFNGIRLYYGAPFKLMSSANDGLMYFLSVCAFIAFRNMNISSNIILCLIAQMAPYTFGVYLIHENPLLRQMGLWKFLIPDSFSIPMPLHCFLVALSLFMLCCAIDFLRTLLFKSLKVNTMCEVITARLPKSL